MLSEKTRQVGLRIDVDTYTGTRDGLPNLLSILDKYQVRASIFFSVGPDNMGRHVWRLLKPKFLIKMIRSNAASLYGWDILLSGTFWPGKKIGKNLVDTIRSINKTEHEVGLHAWDHYAWQTKIDKWSNNTIYKQIQFGIEELGDIIGRYPDCSAVAGWRCNQAVIDIKEKFNFKYNSDCRGNQPFYPILSSGKAGTIQIPVNLPTFDEVVGREIDIKNYNQYLLSKIKPNQFNCYTVHAEVEGGVMAQQFEQMLIQAKEKNIQFMPLGKMILDPTLVKKGKLIKAPLPGREGWVAWQESALN